MFAKLLQTVLCLLALSLSLGYAQTTLTMLRGEDEVMEAVIAAFQEENPDINIDSIEIVDGGYEAAMQRLLLSVAAGDPPDLMRVGNNFIRTAVQNANAVPLEPFIASDSTFNVNNLYESMTRLGEVDGQRYAVPVATSTPVLYYNEEAFVEAGLDPEAPPQTWDATLEAAEKLKEAGYQGIVWGWDITGNWIVQTMIESAGGRMGSEDGLTPMFHEEAGVQAAEYLDTLVERELMPIVTDPDTLTLFASGTLGMVVHGSPHLFNLREDGDFTVRVAPVPTPDGSAPRLPAGGNGAVMFSQDPEKQQAAWRFIRFLTEQTAGSLLVENTGYVPATRSLVESLRAQGDDPDYQVIVSQAPNVVPWYAWPGANSTQIVQTIADAFESILRQRQEPEEALNAAAESVQALLER